MPITLTDRAAGKIKELLDRHSLGEKGCLRVTVRDSTCADFAYSLDLAGSPGEGDEVFESLGVRIACDPKSLRHIEGTQIDYNPDASPPSFLFHNPHAKRSCRCGRSFAV